MKRGGFGRRATPLIAHKGLVAKTPPKRTKGLEPGPPPARTKSAGDRPKTPQQQKRAAKQAEWPKVRDQVLERDDWTCVRCGRSDLRLEVHHRRHRSQGGEDVPSNLVVLCGVGNHSRGDELCHGWAHDRANSDAVAVGLSVPWGTEPHELEVLYPDGRRYLLGDDGQRVAL